MQHSSVDAPRNRNHIPEGLTFRKGILWEFELDDRSGVMWQVRLALPGGIHVGSESFVLDDRRYRQAS